MANQQPNNAPFLSQQNYGAVAGTSTSPFTDERAVATGGSGGGGTGNVTFLPKAGQTTFGRINYTNSVGAQTDITEINNSGDDVARVFELGSFLSTAQIGARPAIVFRSSSNETTITGNSLNLLSTNLVNIESSSVVDIESTDDTTITSTAGNVNIQSDLSFVNISGTQILSTINDTFTINLGTQGSVVKIGKDGGTIERLRLRDIPTADFVDNAATGSTNTISMRLFSDSLGGNEGYFSLRNKPPPADAQNPSQGYYIRTNGFGSCAETDPAQVLFSRIPIADMPNGARNSTLTVSYDKENNALSLNETASGATTAISTADIVPGRTVLISRVSINQYNTETSIMELAPGTGTTPPSASVKLVGNNPPRVPLDSQGNSLWTTGNSFRVTASGRLFQTILNDRIQVKIYSNRGQTSELMIGSFNVVTVDSNQAQLGWKMLFEFTCRTTGTNGTFSGNAQFLYSDDTAQRAVEGAIWVQNANNTFNTNIAQYLDITFTLFGQGGMSLACDVLIIERLF